MEKDILDLTAEKILEMPNQVICTFYQDKKVCTIGIDIDRNEQIGVYFEKGYVVVRTQPYFLSNSTRPIKWNRPKRTNGLVCYRLRTIRFIWRKQ